MANTTLVEWRDLTVSANGYYDVQSVQLVGKILFSQGAEVSTQKALLASKYPPAIAAGLAAKAAEADLVMGADITGEIDFGLWTTDPGTWAVQVTGGGAYFEAKLGDSSASRRAELIIAPDGTMTSDVVDTLRGRFLPSEAIPKKSQLEVGLNNGEASMRVTFESENGDKIRVEQIGTDKFLVDLSIGNFFGISSRTKIYVVEIPGIDTVYPKYDTFLGDYKGTTQQGGGIEVVKYSITGSDNGVGQTTWLTYHGDTLVGFRRENIHKYNGKEVGRTIDSQTWDDDGWMTSAEHQSFGPIDSGNHEVYVAERRRFPDGRVEETILVQVTEGHGYETTKFSIIRGEDGEILQYGIKNGDDSFREITEEEFLEQFEAANPTIKPYCFAAGTPIDMADGTQKPIEQVTVGDFVLAYDPERKDCLGELAARRVTRTYATPDKMVLDFHGVLVTPGHVFLCGDGPHKGKHRMLIDILRDDGAVVVADGRAIRAATNAPLGSAEDAFLQVRYLPAGADSARREGRLRAGTLLLTEAGKTASILQLLDAEGYAVTADGLIARDGEEPHPLHWYGTLPRPEDYVLQVSNLTDADLAGDPDYIPEVASDGGPVLGAGWSPAGNDGAAPSLFLGGGAPKHGGETLH